MTDFSLKAYGLARYPDEAVVIPYDDFSIVTNPNTLREIAKFLLHCAETMDKLSFKDSDGWHMHLRDYMGEWQEGMVDLIVCT